MKPRIKQLNDSSVSEWQQITVQPGGQLAFDAESISSKVLLSKLSEIGN